MLNYISLNVGGPDALSPDLTDTMKGLKGPAERLRGEPKQSSADLNAQTRHSRESIGLGRIGGAKMEEGVTIAKVPDWMELKPR